MTRVRPSGRAVRGTPTGLGRANEPQTLGRRHRASRRRLDLRPRPKPEMCMGTHLLRRAPLVAPAQRALPGSPNRRVAVRPSRVVRPARPHRVHPCRAMPATVKAGASKGRPADKCRRKPRPAASTEGRRNQPKARAPAASPMAAVPEKALPSRPRGPVLAQLKRLQRPTAASWVRLPSPAVVLPDSPPHLALVLLGSPLHPALVSLGSLPLLPEELLGSLPPLARELRGSLRRLTRAFQGGLRVASTAVRGRGRVGDGLMAQSTGRVVPDRDRPAISGHLPGRRSHPVRGRISTASRPRQAAGSRRVPASLVVRLRLSAT
ncbi:hypothetical protein SAMN05421748_101190 [Paractinoplanes atraurantiacus]|uniref:Uncharacterized protein n=1 Tax=Paractinoplanes atraurantiacus TaxID=1036182 RepID=A0A285EYZ7_9ACTN|nr:hypothetical protein SAMN05421748_101190 [Actinoplanes atraurantiacus]